MSANRTISDLFQQQPHRWGLRGDPHLWRAMQQRLAHMPFPPNAAELRMLIERTFEVLTGSPISAQEPFYVERFSHGGMSSGYVVPEFWRTTALPLLIERYEQEYGQGGEPSENTKIP